jgi:hypothetical protein
MIKNTTSGPRQAFCEYGQGCLTLEVAEAGSGDLFISDSGDTFRGRIKGSDVTQLVRAFTEGTVNQGILDAITTSEALASVSA